VEEKKWVFAETDRGAAERLGRSLNISSLTASMLITRGVTDPGEAKVFLRPDLNSILDPHLFNDMGKAVDRLITAVREDEKIGILGDYDVDGTAGTAILVKFFRFLGNDALYRIPHRVKDGYGLNEKVVREFGEAGVRVLITIDCGTSNIREIALAKELGMDTIVVDHHESPKNLPDAVAILNPKLEQSGYPFPGICSTGIAFKLAWALSDKLAPDRKKTPEYQAFLLDAMGYVAMGTIADVCPLVGENRIFVAYGLEALRKAPGMGIRALLEKARVGDKPIDGFDVGFKLAPRLNALGRIGSAQDTVDLLVSESEDRVASIINGIEATNRKRREIEREISEQAVEMVEANGYQHDPVIVVADERWHLGVVGIVAARLVDRYSRPALVLAIDDEGLAKGSGRSLPGLELHEVLLACTDLLIKHGGHAMAAGLTMEAKNLKAFRRRMIGEAAKRLEDFDLGPTLAIDGKVSLSELTAPVVKEVERLAPHGEGNPRPILAASDVRILGEPRLMGRKNDHVSFFVSQGGPGIRAVGFGMGDRFDELMKHQTCSLAFTPQINNWRGNESVELKLEDIRF
jgi:single-stranded-DNA-specific exonuclease